MSGWHSAQGPNFGAERDHYDVGSRRFLLEHTESLDDHLNEAGDPRLEVVYPAEFLELAIPQRLHEPLIDHHLSFERLLEPWEEWVNGRLHGDCPNLAIHVHTPDRSNRTATALHPLVKKLDTVTLADDPEPDRPPTPRVIQVKGSVHTESDPRINGALKVAEDEKRFVQHSDVKR